MPLFILSEAKIGGEDYLLKLYVNFILKESLYGDCCLTQPSPQGGVSVNDTTGVRIRTVVIRVFFV